jgi:hypothetical protein
MVPIARAAKPMVTINSASGTLALMQGVPVIALDLTVGPRVVRLVSRYSISSASQIMSKRI